VSATRVVVTGGCGFIGSHLVEALVRQGDEVTVFDVGPPPPDAMSGADVRYVVADIRNADRLGEAIRGGVDVVYHLASVVGVDQYLRRPTDVIDINVTGARNTLDRAAAVGARVVVASTSEVFGKNPDVPWPEDGDRVLGPTTADRWVYSTSKALIEHLTFGYRRHRDLDATVVRYFNVYGPRQRPAYVISRSVHRTLNGLAPVVYDNGRQTRSFTYVGDAVDGTLRVGAATPAPSHVFNIGSMQETTIADAVALVAQVTGFSGVPVTVDTSVALGPGYEDLPRRLPDAGRARQLLGWSAGTSLREGVTRTVEWARANPWWLAMPDRGASRESVSG
jgi:dTDP-alpha-D-glucuronic acid decarboxylase